MGIDQYFDWYDMSDARKIHFAKRKLTGQARLYWSNVERTLERAGQEPVALWDEMKE